MNLGKTIKTVRKKRGLNQEQLSARCSITQAYLSQIENNMKEPNLATLKMISSQLNVPIPFLFFLSINEDDIAIEKREAYKIIGPSINAMVSEFFGV